MPFQLKKRQEQELARLSHSCVWEGKMVWILENVFSTSITAQTLHVTQQIYP
jgi:hypothetical protein